MAGNYNLWNGPNFMSMGHTLLNLVDIHNCESIIDAGCGEGTLAVEIALRKNPKAVLHPFDLSPHMTKITSAKLKVLAKMSESCLSSKVWDLNQAISKINFDEEVSISKEEFDQDQVYLKQTLGATVSELSVEDLTALNSDSYDAYLSILTLHIPPD